MPSDPAKGVFVSYRRKDGAVLARLVQEVLLQDGEGLDIFLDLEHRGPGHFDQRIEENIRKRLHFVLIGTGDSLLRPQEGEEDWVKREIEFAIDLKRNIIPFIDARFTWPAMKHLPPKLHFLDKLERIKFDNETWHLKDGPRSRLLDFLRTNADEVNGRYERYKPAPETEASELEARGRELLQKVTDLEESAEATDVDKAKANCHRSDAADLFREAIELWQDMRRRERSYETADREAHCHELLYETIRPLGDADETKTALLNALARRKELLKKLPEGDPRWIEQVLKLVQVLNWLAHECENGDDVAGQRERLMQAAALAQENLARIVSEAQFEVLGRAALTQADIEWNDASDVSKSQSLERRSKTLDVQARIVAAGARPDFIDDYCAGLERAARDERSLKRLDTAADYLKRAAEHRRKAAEGPDAIPAGRSLCDCLELRADVEHEQGDATSAMALLEESLGLRMAISEAGKAQDDLRKLSAVLARCTDAWRSAMHAPSLPALFSVSLAKWASMVRSKAESLAGIDAALAVAEARDLWQDIEVVRVRCRALCTAHDGGAGSRLEREYREKIAAHDSTLAKLAGQLRDLAGQGKVGRELTAEDREVIAELQPGDLSAIPAAEVLRKAGKADRYRQLTPITKSQFKLGLDCIQKLRHSRLRLPQDGAGDDLSLLLAEGGAAVEALQRAIEPGAFLGDIARDEAASESMRHVAAAVKAVRDGSPRESIYEVTVEIDGFLARLDLVRVFADRIELVEIKAKAKPLDGMLTARGGIRSEWRPYIQDVCFQHQVLRQWAAHHHEALGLSPNFPITARLLLVDPSGAASGEDIFDRRNFRVEYRKGSRGVRATVEYVGKQPPAATALLCEVPIDAELSVAQANAGSSVEIFKDRGIAECMATMRAMADADHWPDPSESIGTNCIGCEFRSHAEERSGFARCWGMPEFPRGHVAELARVSDRQFRTAITTLGRNAMVSDLPEESLRGIQLTQWRATASGRPEVDPRFAGDPLAAMVPAGWTGPVCFLDFETVADAIPSRVGGHPYEHVPFQFEGHRLPHPAAGLLERARLEGFLELEAADPRRKCVDALRAQLGAEGPVFHWGIFERMVLRQLRESLARDAAAGDDGRIDFIDSLIDPGGRGEGRLVDLLPIAQAAFYHPMLRGSYSIKRVVPIAWAQPSIRDAFKDGHGAAGDPDSYSGDEDPYEGLAAVSTGALADGGGGDSASSVVTALVDGDAIRNGGMAMLAYHRTRMFGEPHDPAIARQLRRYCGLDSAAIVMVYGLMRDVVATWPRSSRD